MIAGMTGHIMYGMIKPTGWDQITFARRGFTKHDRNKCSDCRSASGL